MGKPVEDREQWGGTLDFILSCLGFAVGIGNVWRFPYLCGRNGGGAFMIPYLIMMIFAGLPVFYMELSLGQYSALAPNMLYRRMSPIFTGIGYTMIMASLYSSIYYNIIIAWALRYLYASLTTDLPFVGCHHDWNTDACFDYAVNSTCNSTSPMYFRGECHAPDYRAVLDNGTEMDMGQLRLFHNDSRQSSGMQFNEYAVGKADDLDTIDAPKWQMVIVLAISWLTVYLCLIKGVKSSGKVVYFTATFPYVILAVLFVRAQFLEGAALGINFFITPQFDKLSDPNIWKDAANQIFFSLSLGGGGLSTLASYNKFNNNLFRDTLIVVLGNCATSVFAGFIIFPIIGYVATVQGLDVEQVSASGTTLAFIVYPEALSQMWPSWLWAILFFFMLMLLGIDSQLVYVEVVMTAFLDRFPVLRKTKYRIMVLSTYTILAFLVGLLFCTPQGKFFVTVFDNYGGGLPLVVACCAEVMMVSWVYGVRRFIGDLRLMLGKPPNTFYRVLGYPVNLYWVANWLVITPILLTAIIISALVTTQRTTMGDYVFPVWADILGVLILLSCILWIPGWAIFRIIEKFSRGLTWREIIAPAHNWGGKTADNLGYDDDAAEGHAKFSSSAGTAKIYVGEKF